jgi:hypothetical protein
MLKGGRMKKMALVCAAAALVATSANAGGTSAPIMEPEVIAADTTAGSSSNPTMIVAVMGLLMVLATNN